MDPRIKIIPNFIDDDNINLVKSFLDRNQNNLTTNSTKKRFQLKLGRDLHNSNLDSVIDLSRLEECRDFICNEYIPKVIETVKEQYGIDYDLYVASLWMAKQIAGAQVKLHGDHDNGDNPHFRYSLVTYLNEVKIDGILRFPYINYEYSPVRGETIVFPAVGEYEREFDHEVLSIHEDRYSIPIWLTDDPEFDLLSLYQKSI